MTDHDAPHGGGAADDPDERDRALLDALAQALAGPASVDDLIARCEGLLTWIDVDAELASLLDQAPAELAGTRGGSASTDLEFTVDDGSCVVEITLVDGQVRGQIIGPAPERVTLRTVTGTATPVDVDGLGAFVIENPPSGSARVELELDAGRRIHTAWFVI